MKCEVIDLRIMYKELVIQMSDRIEADIVSLLYILEPKSLRRCFTFFILIVLFGLAIAE